MYNTIEILWELIKALVVIKLLIEAYRAIKESIKPDAQNTLSSAPKISQWWTNLYLQRKRGSGPRKWLAEVLYFTLTTIDDLFTGFSFLDEVIGKYIKRLFALVSKAIRAVFSILVALARFLSSLGKGLIYALCSLLAIGTLVLYVFSPLIMYNLTSPITETTWWFGYYYRVRFPPMRISDASPRIDATATTLLGIVIALGLFTLISEVKVLDVIELKRNLTSFKKEVDDKISHVTATLSTIVHAQSLLQTSQQTQVTHNVFLDTGLQTIADLQEKIISKLGVSSDAISDIRLRDLPSPLNPVEGVNSLFKLRFLIEEKLKSLATVSDIPATLDALSLIQALKDRGLQRDLARSIENIIRITDEVARGIQLTPQQTDMILRSGASTLAAMEKTRSKWERPQHKEAESENANSEARTLEQTNQSHD